MALTSDSKVMDKSTSKDADKELIEKLLRMVKREVCILVRHNEIAYILIESRCLG